MESTIAQLLTKYEDGTVTRRQLIQALAAVVVAAADGTGAAAQSRGFQTLTLDHVAYNTTDYGRIRDFYADLLGLAVVNDNGKNNCELHWGAPPHVGVRSRPMMSLTNVREGRPAGIDHLAFSIADWQTDRVRAELERRGLQPRLAAGGDLDTPNYVSLTVPDPDGLGVQISGIAQPGDAHYTAR